MSGTNLVRSGFPPAYFPIELWDGLTANHFRSDINDPPNGDDYKRLTIEIISLQDHLNALFARDSNNNIQLNNPVWREFRFTVNNLRVPASDGPTWTVYKTTEILSFTDQAVEGDEERVFFTIKVPFDHLKGTNIRPHIYWVGEDGTEGDVAWKMSYNIGEIGSQFTANKTTTASASNFGLDIYNYDEFGVIDLSLYDDAQKSIVVIGEIRRNSSNAIDTFNGKDAYLVEVGFSYQSQSVGYPSLEGVSTIVKGFAAAFTGSGLLTADLFDKNFLTSDIVSSGLVTAALNVTKKFTTDVTGSGIVTAALNVTKKFTTDVTGSGIVTADLAKTP